MTQNKLIAEFMEINVITLDDVRKNKNPYISSADGYLEDDLKYHCSWDWLMLVIEKCFDNAEDGDMQDIMHHLMVVDFDNTYDAVVQFINQYNKNK